MKAIKKYFLILILATMIIFNMISVVEAASFKASVSASSATIERGKEVVISISISDIDVGNGIQALQGTLQYDSSALIYSSIQASAGWGSPLFNPENGSIVVESGDYITKEQQVLKITFKVKEDAKVGDTVVTFKDVKASDGEIMVNANQSSVTIKVAEVKTDEGDNNTTGNNTTDNNTTNGTDTNNNANQNSNTNTNNNNANSNTNVTNSANNTNKAASNSLPKTGIESYIGFIILAVIIVAIVSYIKYKKYKNV